MSYELIKLRAPEELAEEVSQQWLNELRSISASENLYCVALSGGRIARQFFAAFARLPDAKVITTQPIHFFWGDERCVPPNNPESNFGLARDLFLTPLGVPDDRVHRIRGEEKTDFAAAEAEAELCRIASLDDEGQPQLDLIFLGMGEDGHVASLFPGEPEEVSTSRAVYRSVVASKPPPQRITIGYPALAAARQVWVLASGPGKEAALRASLKPGATTPLARVIGLRKNTRVFSDIPLG